MARMFRIMLLCALLATLLAGCLEEDWLADEETPAVATRTPRPSRTTTSFSTNPASAANDPADESAKWTVLVYLDGDNNLEESALDDFNEMARVGSTDEVNIVVQFDRISSDEDWDDTRHGDWTGVKRFHVQQRQRPSKSSQIADLGELNMGDPETLVDFITWGVERYPAEHYGLIFWDHGASWPGVANDDTSDGDPITLPELTDALEEATYLAGIRRFDLIGFDTCLMAQLDVLEAIAPYGEVAVGSADLEPGDGWAWQAWLGELVADPDLAAPGIATHIVDSFIDFFRKRDEPTVTLAAFDLRRVGVVRDRLADLAGALMDDMAGSYKTLGKARSYVAEYSSGDEDVSAVDVGHLAQLLARQSNDPRVVEAAQGLEAALQRAVIAEGHGEAHPNATGLSVYYPRKRKHYDEGYPLGSPLPGQTSWDDFLHAFYASSRSATRSRVAPPIVEDLTIGTRRPLALRSTIEGDSTAFVYRFVGEVDPDDQNTVRTIWLDYVYPPGAVAPGDLPAWSEEGSDVHVGWPATSWYLSNGTDIIAIPLTPIRYGSRIYGLDGDYTASATGTTIDARIEFELGHGRGRLLHIWGLAEGAAGELQPYEIEPRVGDTFTPYIDTYTTRGDDVEEGVIHGETIVFGATPLVAAEGPAPSGEYVVGLLVENIAGDITEEYVDIVVDNQGAAMTRNDFLPRGAVPGEQPGTVVYDDPAAGIRFEYPQSWELAETGSDQIVLYELGSRISTFLSIDIVVSREQPEQARVALLAEFLEQAREAQTFEQQGEVIPLVVSGTEADKVVYRYQRDGRAIEATAIAISGASRAYLLLFEMPADSDEAERAVFERMLVTLRVDTE